MKKITIGYLWFNDKNIFYQSIFTYFFISIIQNFDILDSFCIYLSLFCRFFDFQQTIFKKIVKNVKKGPIVFQLKMRQKHGLRDILIKLAWFSDFQQTIFKKEVKNVKKGPIVFQLKNIQKHGLLVILSLLCQFFNFQQTIFKNEVKNVK